MEYNDIFNFSIIAEAKKTGDLALVSEASLTRILGHWLRAKNETSSFAILTSWRGNLTKPENEMRLVDLKQKIRSAGLGFIPLTGHWKECQDDNVAYDDCPEDRLKDSTEPSLFIPEISKEQAMAFLKTYNQDAIVYAGPETGGKVALLFNDGSDMEIGEFSPGSVTQAYSTWKDRDFHFECVAKTKTEKFVEKLFS